MPLTFTVVLQQFRQLRQQANDESHAMRALAVGTRILLSAQEFVRAGAIADSAPLAKALRSFVVSLPDKHLFAVLALIYAGRDGAADPVKYWESHIRSTVNSRSAAISVVLEKDAAAEHIHIAVESLPASLILDEIPELLSSPI